jgi:hypothetical protein
MPSIDDSMDHCLLEAESCSGTQEIPHLSWNSNFHYCAYKPATGTYLEPSEFHSQLYHGIFYPKDGGSGCLQNTGNFLPGHMASYPRKQYLQEYLDLRVEMK